MNRRSMLAAVAAAVIAGGVALASPAMAASPSPGPSQAVTGTITVGTSLTMSTTVSDFSLDYTNQTVPMGTGQFTVTTNNGAGYFVDIQGPAQFGSPPGIATSAVVYNPTSTAPNLATWLTLPTVATQVYAKGSASATGGDQYAFGGFVIGSPINPAPGTYPGVISFTAWAN